MRLIDADALGNRLYHEVFEKDSEDQRWDSGCWMRYRLFEKVLREQPTVAQPERKRGKWKIIMARHKYNGEYREVRQCSECHTAYFHYANQEDIEDEIPNFCPHCGAKMEVDDGSD